MLALGGSAIASAGYRHYKLENLASTDDLTQLINRRYFNKYLEREWDRQTKLKKELSLILCDVDYFKRYNDTYGHQSGDECLQQVAQALHQAVRANDLVARYGGEKFAIILPNANAQIATQVAQRICFEVKALQIPHAQSHVSPYVTLSCGIACTFPEGKSLPQDLIATADRALYEAKEQGRDRVYLGCLG